MYFTIVTHASGVDPTEGRPSIPDENRLSAKEEAAAAEVPIPVGCVCDVDTDRARIMLRTAMMELEELRRKLLGAFPDATVEVADLTGTKDHFRAEIVSSQFAGKALIEQHKMVYAALGEAMNGPIHALTLRTRSP